MFRVMIHTVHHEVIHHDGVVHQWSFLCSSMGLPENTTVMGSKWMLALVVSAYGLLQRVDCGGGRDEVFVAISRSNYIKMRCSVGQKFIQSTGPLLDYIELGLTGYLQTSHRFFHFLPFVYFLTKCTASFNL